VADLYGLTRDDFMQFDRMGDKLAENLLTAIQRSKHRELARFIFALGIRHVGSTRPSSWPWPSQYRQRDQGHGGGAAGGREIGPQVARSIREFFNNPENQRVVERLLAAGVTPSAEEKRVGGKFTGKTFVFTGALSRFSRAEAQQLVEREGGHAAGSVSKKTDFVVAGAEAGSKLDKAGSWG